MSLTSIQMVSIVTPCYNSAQYIAGAIESVLSQTYPFWEMIIVDDCSTDETFEIISKYQKQEKRIRVYKMQTNSGTATVPRNYGIEKAEGEFIAFLDSDDIWLPTKLEKQIALASEKDAVLIYSYYEKINEQGVQDNRAVKSPLVVTYKQLLTGNVIGCLTAMYSIKQLGKKFFKQVGHEDFALWLEILRQNHNAYCVPEVLALYRVGNSSLSSNKIKAFVWTWNIYRNVEEFSVAKSAFLFLQYSIKAFLKYLI